MPLPAKDDELRAALRRFMSAEFGEEEIQRLMAQPEERIDAWDNSRRLPEGPKSREQVLDYFVGLSSGLTEFFKDYHAEHGVYPEFPSGGMLSDMH
jgi:hypothetical protein